jgi:hypothetical protein
VKGKNLAQVGDELKGADMLAWFAGYSDVGLRRYIFTQLFDLMFIAILGCNKFE